jgi:hypothetical protein
VSNHASLSIGSLETILKPKVFGVIQLVQ